MAATTKASAIEQENYIRGELRSDIAGCTAGTAPDAAKNPFVTLLGASLQSKAGTLPTAAGLAGKKAVGLYFSLTGALLASSSRPCWASVTPTHSRLRAAEIVFVSSDNDDEFTSYYMEQADWLALPYAHATYTRC